MSTGQSVKRGDLVIIDFRTFNPRFGVRPALVVQNDQDNRRMSNTIVAQVTTNIRRAVEITQLLIDQQHPDWNSSGLHHPSVVNCSNIYTIERRDIARVIGSLSNATLKQVDECLRAALAIV
jgi:mRNA interferase MazF